MRRKIVSGLLLVLTLLTADICVAQPFAEHSRLATGTWYRIPVSRTGIYKLTTAELPALNGVACSQIALYGAPGDQLSTRTDKALPDDLTPAAIEVADANGNGTFDAGDHLLFYAEGPNVWRYVSGDQRFEYQMHAYATQNCYYLTLNASSTGDAATLLRIRQSTLTGANRGDLNHYTGVAVIHEDKQNPNQGGQVWVADKFTASLKERYYELTLPGIQQNANIYARYGLASQSKASAQFDMKYNSENRQHPMGSGEVYNTFLETFTARTNATVTLTCTYRPSENNAEGFLDFIELNSNAPLSYPGSQWHVRNSQQVGDGNSCRFVLTTQATGLRAWDVTAPSQPIALTISETGGNKAFIASTETEGTYLVFKEADAYTPTGITALDNQDLHGAETPDFVIVTHKDFRAQAERLAALHARHDGMRVLVATQEEVFNEFSSGKPDPIAIRALMRCLREHQTSPGDKRTRYLMLFGKGTYDNRNILDNDAATVITYETPASADFSEGAYPTDDIYGLGLDDEAGSQTLSLSIGRLPARNVAEATHLVDKIEGYMEHNDFARSDIRGDWRNYVCLLSDDADPSSPGDTDFVASSEKTAQLIKEQYPHFNIDRIYADAYVQQSGADGSYYPDVNNALRQRINYGCLLLNYIGHGSSQYIGTERYMSMADIEKYTNTDRLTFFVTSTCTFGQYDRADELSGGEDFLLAEAAGIGIVAAARPIAHIQRFNTDVCLYALDGNNTIGDALRLAKNSTSVSRSITLLGDPALRLSIPENKIVVTKVNDRAVEANRTDSAEVLSRVTIEGEIQDPAGNIMTDFNGEIYPIVFDREVTSRTLANDNDSTEVPFKLQKNILYKGREQVENGRFSYSFIVPRDVSYHYDYAKLSHYAHGDSLHATGQYGNIMFGGFDESVVIEELHPTVTLYLNDSTFRNGGITNETPTLYARLWDSIGINAAGSGLGHDITATVDGNSYSTVTLNDFFEPDIADSRGGTVRYTLGKLDDGHHTLTLKCWNIFNFSGSASIDFYVVNDRNPVVSRVSAAPNPANDRTQLRVEHNMGSRMKSCRLDIYSIQGALVNSFAPEPVEGSSVTTVDWDFTSFSGATISHGVYILRATIITDDDQKHVETGKVIKN